MTHTPHTDLLRYVRSHWQRWQGAVAGLYYRRVTQPVQFWLALGQPREFTPQLPWWQFIVWYYLVWSGWLRPARRRERPV